MNELVQKIVDKLKVFDIRRIMSIDDSWNIGSRAINIDTDTDLQRLLSDKGIVISKPENDLLVKYEIIYLEELFACEESGLLPLKEKIKIITETKPALDETLVSLDFLLTEIQNNLEDVQIIKKSDKVSDSLEFDENCLFILDKNMGKNNSDVIIESILSIGDKRKDKHDLIIIYSNELGNDFLDHESKFKYLEGKVDGDNDKKLLLIYQMWAINKTAEKPNLAKQFNDKLSDSIYGSSLYKLILSKKDSANNAFKDLIMIDTNQLSTIFTDSYIEGDSIYSSITNLIDMLIKKNEYLGYESNNKSIENILSYEREKIGLLPGGIASKNKYKVFRNTNLKNKLISSKTNSSHFDIIDYIINKSYADISTGDIFRFKVTESDEWQYALLISQACNCVIRIQDYGDPVDRANKEMKLLLFNAHEISNSYSDEEIEKISRGISSKIWPVMVDGKMLILSPIEKTKILPDFILDLCSLNVDGNAKIDFDVDIINKYKPYHSMDYFRKFKKSYIDEILMAQANLITNRYEEAFSNLYQDVTEEIACSKACATLTQTQDVIKELQKKVRNDIISLKYDINYKNNIFDLERIGRLEPKRTLLLAQEYIYKLSKAGADPLVSIGDSI
jgi:hypothetical protein